MSPLAEPSRVVAELLAANGIRVDALFVAWARTLPTVTIVPAFGLRALPNAARAMLAIVMAVILVPTVAAAPLTSTRLIHEAAIGIGVALAAAAPLWAATMAGGLVDTLRGSNESNPMAWADGRVSPLGALFSLVASYAFLLSGGASRIAQALVTVRLADSIALSAMHVLISGIEIATAIAAPLLAASIVIEMSSALIVRALSPAQVSGVLAPIRGVAMLVLLGVVFERIEGLITRIVSSPLRFD